MSATRLIIHVDMDAFFASVEVLDDPKLADKPVVVGGKASDRGVVAAASYQARTFGVYSAMAMSKAVRLCPNAVIIRPRMSRYAEVSAGMHEIFQRYTPLIEPISLDEAFLDVTASIGIWKDAQEIGTAIKKAIKDELGLIASVGIAPNKFLAKLASDLDKPDGFVVITEDNAQEILDRLTVSKIWGVGKVTAKKLLDCGIKTIEQLRNAPLSHLKSIVGNQAEGLLNLAHGSDNRPVEPAEKAKSMSAEHTFVKDITGKDILLGVLLNQIDEVATRLRGSKMQAKTIMLKFRYADFRTITRSHSLKDATDLTETFWQTAQQMFNTWHRSQTAPLRLLGFAVSSLTDIGIGQQSLFKDAKQERFKKVDTAVDQIKKKFGKDAISRKF